MNIGLMKDGSFKIYNNPDKILNNLSGLKYMIFDISTALKGPVHTIVKPKYIANDDMECTIDITVLYALFDCPSSDTTTIKYSLSIDRINNRYNIYPLIKQMWDFNFYKENMEFIDTDLTIINISLKIGETTIEINEDLTEKEIEKLFRKLNLMTNVESLDKRHIILYKDEWSLSKDIPPKSDFVFYNLKSNESLYLLSYIQYHQFNDIQNLSIQMFNRWQVDEYESMLYGIEHNYIDPDNYIDSNNIDSIIESCIYFPQYIELEKLIYHNKMEIKIDIETSIKKYSLTVTEKEFLEYPIKVFDIINKIIQI